jgi:pimeloyl-ACP methyl ester carboxylesterase
MPDAREGWSKPSRSSRLPVIALGLALASLMPAAQPQAAVSAPRPAQPGTQASHPHVYLMRGLLNIFSLGMDQLATEIQSHGISAEVYNHTVADAVVANIVAKYRAGDHGPYILVGHSLGADAVMQMAQSLNAQGVPVALVVPFDGTGSYAAAKNVACVLNLTQREYAYMRPGSGFHGKLQNVDVSGDPGIDHFTIDKSPRLQNMALTSILQTAHAEGCRPPAGSAVVASPKPQPGPRVAAPNSKPASGETRNGSVKIGPVAPAEAPKQSTEAPAANSLNSIFGSEG